MDILPISDNRWEADPTELSPETERASATEQSRTSIVTVSPVACSPLPSARAGWGRSALIIAVLSVLSWAAFTLIVIAELSAL
jgi:hypothetical protein